MPKQRAVSFNDRPVVEKFSGGPAQYGRKYLYRYESGYDHVTNLERDVDIGYT